MKIDLHLHSHYSDGRLAPTAVVQEASKLGLEIISLTDHENVGGMPEAIEIGEKLGIKVIPGIEFAVTDHEGKEQHLLGLSIDYRSQELKDFLEIWEKTKVRQILTIVKNLQEKGFKIEFEEVAVQTKGSLGRAHIAYAIFENRENAAILCKFGVQTPTEFFHKFLNEDSPETVYAERERPQIKEVIRLTKEIHGIAVWAHPFWKKQEIDLIKQKCRIFQELGLGGIEVCYSRIFSSREKALALHQIAQNLGLYETAGSDFHSFSMPMLNKLADFETFGLELRLPPELTRET